MTLDFTPIGIVFSKTDTDRMVFIPYSAISAIILQPEEVWTSNFCWEKTGKYQIRISITCEANTLTWAYDDYDTANDMFEGIISAYSHYCVTQKGVINGYSKPN